MLLRIRFGAGSKIGRKPRKAPRLALGLASLLTPAAALAAVLALWRIAADLNLSGSFAIESGLCSHWHVWMAIAVLLQFAAHLLNRYGKSRRISAPE